MSHCNVAQSLKYLLVLSVTQSRKSQIIREKAPQKEIKDWIWIEKTQNGKRVYEIVRYWNSSVMHSSAPNFHLYNQHRPNSKTYITHSQLPHLTRGQHCIKQANNRRVSNLLSVASPDEGATVQYAGPTPGTTQPRVSCLTWPGGNIA